MLVRRATGARGFSNVDGTLYAAIAICQHDTPWVICVLHL